MTLSLVRLILAIAAVGGLLAAYVISDDPKYRYREFGCNYGLSYEDDRPVFLAGTGGSRMKTSFGAETLQSLLSEKLGREVTVFNASHNRRSPELEYVITRDFIERHDTTNFVVFFDPEPGRNKPHDQFPALARLSDFHHVLFADHEKQWYERVADFMQLIARRFDRWGEAAARTKKVPDGAPYADCHLRDMPPNVDRLAAAGPVIPPAEIPALEWEPEDPKLSYFLYFMERLAHAGRENGTNIFFVHLPFRNRPTMTAEHAAYVKRHLGAHLLVMPADVLRELAERGYRDNTHMYQPGRDIYLPWLAQAIASACSEMECS